MSSLDKQHQQIDIDVSAEKKSSYIDELVSAFQKNMRSSTDTTKQLLDEMYTTKKTNGKTDADIKSFIEALTVKLKGYKVSSESFDMLSNLPVKERENLWNKEEKGIIVDTIKSIASTKQVALKKELAEKKAAVGKKKEILTQNKAESETQIEQLGAEKETNTNTVETQVALREKNNAILAYLQKNPLNVSQQELDTVRVSLTPKARELLTEKFGGSEGLTPEQQEHLYKQYIYTLERPALWTPELKTIIGQTDVENLYKEFVSEYKMEKLWRRSHESMEKDAQKGEEFNMSFDNILPPSAGKNAMGFKGAFSAFEKMYFDPAKNQHLHTALDTKIQKYVGADWLREKQTAGNGKRGIKTQDAFAGIGLSTLIQETSGLTTLTEQKLRYILAGSVPENQLSTQVQKLLTYVIAPIQENPALLQKVQTMQMKDIDKNKDKELFLVKQGLHILNSFAEKRFLHETQTVVKKEVAQTYFMQVADVMKAGGEELIMNTDMDAVVYGADETMTIAYHTAQGMQGKMVVAPDGTTSITDHIAQGGNGQEPTAQQTLQRRQRTLIGGLPTFDSMMKNASSKPHIFAQARQKQLAQTSYDSPTYEHIVSERKQDFLGYNPAEQYRIEAMHASMDHFLHTTRVFNSVNAFATPYTREYADPFLSYTSGKEDTLHAYNTPDHIALYAMAETCRQATADDLSQLEQAIKKLDETYNGKPETQNPFLQSDMKQEHIRRVFDYFRRTDTQKNTFDISAFSLFVEKIAQEQPGNIHQWFIEKEERVGLLPLTSPHHKKIETAYADTSAEGYLQTAWDTVAWSV